MEEIKILLYHSVGAVDPKDNLGIRVKKEDFRSQMEFLKKRDFNVWMLNDAVECIKKRRPIPKKTAAITFDDGYRDNVLNAAPIMEEFGFRATFFITVDYIGKVKTNPKRPWQRWECMDWSDLKGLLKRGHDIGSHSLHHINLAKSTKDVKEEEVRLSKAKLGSSLGREIDFFSYPYGYFDDELIEVLRKEGHKAACTTIAGGNGYSADLYRLKRTEIVNQDGELDFMHKMEGRYD